MRRCVTCEGLHTDDHFDGDSPICSVCVNRLQKVFHVEYSAPERKTIKEAYVTLLLSIRDQAVKDDALEDWEKYWLEDQKWSRIWGMLEYVRVQTVHQYEKSNQRIGRHA